MPEPIPDLVIEIQLESSERADLAVLKELKKQYPELSRATLKSFFQARKIFYRDEPLSAALILSPKHYTITLKDWDLASETSEPSASGKPVPPILFEDEELLALNKPSQMPSVPLNEDETDSAVSAVLQHFAGTPAYDKFLSIGRKAKRPLEGGLLHRLDTGTSGVLLFAKSFEEFERLRALWKTKTVRKFYRALVSKTPNYSAPKTPFSINTEIAHDKKSSKKMITLPPPVDRDTPGISRVRLLKQIRGNPLPALTHVLAIQSHLEFLEVSLEIETGVMHQIRVHLASIGLPLVGDPLYGEKPAERLMLHHERLDVPLRSGEICRLICPPQW